MSSGIKPLNDWQKECKDGLQKALQASVEIMGRNGAEACKHAIILMADSARALTRTGKKKRPVTDNPKFAHLMKKSQYKQMRMSGADMSRYYRYTADYLQQDGKQPLVRYANQKPPLAKIGNVGLAKRSWMWGLKKLKPSKVTSRPIPGVAWLTTIISDKGAGYILSDALKYLTKILPAGWEFTVAEKATKKIMWQVRNKIEREYLREMRNVRRGGFAMGQGIQRFFVRA